jgi:hypothetical protein
MTEKLKNIVQWLQAGAKKAKDPRAHYFKVLFTSSTFDPYKFSAIEKNNSIIISGELIYTNIGMSGGIPKLLPGSRAPIVLEISNLTIDGRLKFKEPSINMLPLETILAAWQLYLILQDNNKKKVLEGLIKKEK